ncbi:MAG TPA: phosphoglycerate kinase [Rhodospirillaceae bacterium]|mgnify:CR=1 FL=1|nr:phosphoglycerate kinase [Rhodospirillaceae bacterium]
MRQFKTIDDLDLAGKTVLVRCDFNVPMKDGAVSDATRLERSALTLNDLAAAGARVCVLSHFGRPKGQHVPEMSLKPVAEAFAEVLGRPVAFAADCVGPEAEAVVGGLKDGDVCVLENLRFHAGEEKNDADFAAKLAALGDIYVNDAFSVSHRAHASTEAIARILPAAAGRLMQAELDALTQALEAPEHPVAAVVGGAKVSTKMEVLGNLVAKVDLLIIGGGMANTFLHAQGINVGKSLCEHDMADAAKDILARAEAAGCEVALPVDAVIAREFKEGAPSDVVDVRAVPDDAMILDAGPVTVRHLAERLKDCRTLVWNGPLGAFEIKPFDDATNELARAAAALTQGGSLTSVAGGGDTVAALVNAGVHTEFSYVSAAGGAFLEWLEGKDLPGVAVLRTA